MSMLWGHEKTRAQFQGQYGFYHYPMKRMWSANKTFLKRGCHINTESYNKPLSATSYGKHSHVYDILDPMSIMVGNYTQQT